MSPSIRHPDPQPTATAAAVQDDRLVVVLADGREITVPLSWFHWLERASPADRADLTIVEDGLGIWWERLDEGISAPALLGLPHAT